MSKRKIKQTDEIAKMVFGSVGSAKIFKPKPTFLQPNLKLFDAPDFIAPSDEFISTAIEILQTERLLVIAGGYGINKIALARYLAWWFSNLPKNKSPLTPIFQSGELKNKSPLTPLFQSGEPKEDEGDLSFPSGELKEEKSQASLAEIKEEESQASLAEINEEESQSSLTELKENEGDFSFPNDEISVDDEISVKEWARSWEPQSLDGELSKQKHPTVYLFTQVSRQNFDYGLNRIRKATQKNHYIIITTDAPQENWHRSTEEQNFWLDLDSLPYELYSSDSLMTALDNELMIKKNLQSLPDDEALQNQIIKQLKQSLPNDKTLQNQIKTPEQIARFVSLLIQELKTESSLKKATDNAINTVNHYQQNLRDWYDFILNEQEQLLALGLNLFEGLLVDQVFAALEEVVDNVWQKRDPALRIPDYHDLVKFRHFFQFGMIGLDSKEQNFIESYVSKQRLMLFEMALHCHGRQLLATLPTINHLLKNTISNSVSNEELYGTTTRRKQLQRVLSEAISDIGWISPTLVQKTLCQFAEHPHTSLRMSAAYAIARWRNVDYYGHDQARFEKRHQDLFDLLNQWQEKASIQNIGASAMSSKARNWKIFRFARNDTHQTKNEKRYQTPDYLRATIAFTVGYAAIYEPPDQLHQTLYDFLERLADDQNHYDQNNPAHLSFCFHTLPKVVPWHLLQLRELLRDMTRYPDFIGAISDSLALAYQARPADVLKTLDFWKDNEQETITIFSKQATLPLRELLFTTIALTYGKITCNEEIHPLTAKQAFHYLLAILEIDKSLLVRQAVIIAMGMKLHQNFSEIESEFQNAIPKITQYEHERRKIIDILTFIDLETKNSETVKTAMHRWITDNSNPIAQEIALRALVNFTRIASPKQANRIKQNWLNVKFSKSPTVSKTPPYGPRFEKIIPWIVTRDNKSYQKAIRQLLHEAWKQHKNSKQAMNSVLSHWETTTTDNRKLVHLSHLLRRGFWWLKYLYVLPIAIIGLIVTLLIVPVMTKELLPILSSYQGTVSSLPKSKHIIEGVSLLIAEKAIIRDSDSANFDGGKLSIQLTDNATANDRLGISLSAITEEMTLKTNQNEKQGLVYQILYQNRVIGYLPGDDRRPFEVTLTANATKVETKALIRTLAYQNTSTSPVLGDRKVELQLTDGDGGNSQAFSKIISVVTENEAPVIFIPDKIKTQTLRETHQLSLSGIKVSDSESQELTVTLQANLGKLTVKQNVPRGLTSQNITHAESVKLQGSIEQINTTLANRSAITYQSHLSGQDLLQITVEDGGKPIIHEGGLAWPPGAITPKKAIATINITVLPAIILTVPGIQTVDEDRGLTIGGIRIEAPDSKNATVEFEVSHGILMIKDNVTHGIHRQRLQANNTAKVSIKLSPIAQINRTLQHQEAIIYQGADDSAKPDTLKIRVIDNDNRTAEQSIKILVNPINDAPQITEEVEPPISHESPPIEKPIATPQLKAVPQQKAPPPVPKRKPAVNASSPQFRLGQRAKDRADVRYNRLSSPSPRKWWPLLCQTIDEVSSEEIAKRQMTTRKERQKIWRKVFNGAIDVIHHDERKKRHGWSRNRIKNKILTVCQ